MGRRPVDKKGVSTTKKANAGPSKSKHAPSVSGKRSSVAAPKGGLFLLKVVLMDIRPPIWRTFQVLGNTTLSELHEILQIVMGWEDYHLHQFKIAEDDYGPPDPERYGPPAKDERKAVLSEVAPIVGAKIGYEYDFGDSWIHQITVEKVLPAGPKDGRGHGHPVCMDGARACPLEDCGGPPGYDEMLRVLCGKGDPDHDREQMFEWAGDFEPEEFDLKAVNKQLVELFRK